MENCWRTIIDCDDDDDAAAVDDDIDDDNNESVDADDHDRFPKIQFPFFEALK